MEEQRGRLMLVTGGARSGKSTFAENKALESGKKVIYIATAGADDEEMRRRIKIHQWRRPRHFLTVEERLFPHQVLADREGPAVFFLLDCLTLLLNNHLAGESWNEENLKCRRFLQERFAKTLEYISFFSAEAKNSPADVLVVTNEVGMGVIPENYLGRLFVDLSGRANQLLAKEADKVYFMVCGIAQQVK